MKKEITTNVSEDFKIGLKMGYKKAQEDFKKKIEELKIRLHNGVKCEDGFIRRVEIDETIKEIFSKDKKEKGDLK